MHIQCVTNACVRDAVLVQCVQGSVAVLRGGSLIHVPEALHGRDVPGDALLGQVQLGHEGQSPDVVATEQHGAAVVALDTETTMKPLRWCLQEGVPCADGSVRGRGGGGGTYRRHHTVLCDEDDTEQGEILRLQLRRTENMDIHYYSFLKEVRYG